MLGQLKLKITGNGRQLTVDVLELRGLASESSQRSEVYLKLSIFPDLPVRIRRKTSIVPVSGKNVSIQEKFELEVPEENSSRRLLISAWQKFEQEERFQFIGCMSFNAKKLVEHQKVVHGWYQFLGEVSGKKKHLAAKEYIPSDNNRGDMLQIPLSEGRQNVVRGENVLEDYYTRYLSIDKCSANLNPAGCFTIESRAENQQCSRVEQRTKSRKRFGCYRPVNYTSLRKCPSEIGRSGNIRKSRDCHRRALVGRSSSRTHGWASKESILPKCVIQPALIESRRAKSAKVVSKRNFQLRLQLNSGDLKLLYTDEQECATRGLLQTNAKSKQAETKKIVRFKDEAAFTDNNFSEVITHKTDQKTTSATLLPSTIANDKQFDQKDAIGRPNTFSKESAMPETEESSSGSGVYFLKSDKSVTKNQIKKTVARLEATEDCLNDGATDRSLPGEKTTLKKSVISNEEAETIDVPGVKHCSLNSWNATSLAAVPAQSIQVPNRKRNSGSDSGIYIELSSTEKHNIAAQVCPLKEEGRKIAKYQERKANQKENEIPPKENGFESKGGEVFTRSNSKRSFIKKKSIRRPKKSPENDESATKSFVPTLKDLLKSKSCIQAFREYLKSEFSEENLDFWLECETYKSLKGAKQVKMAAKIFDEYLAKDAKREINIDCEVKSRTAKLLQNSDKETFVEAQNSIFTLMRADSFRRFVTSQNYSGPESKEGFRISLRRASTVKKFAR